MFRYSVETASASTAFVDGGLALLVNTPTPADVERYWQAVHSGSLETVLDALVSSGISAAPAFALADSRDGLRFIVRGAFLVDVTGDDGVSTVTDGTAAAAWIERSVEGFTSFSLSASSKSVGNSFPLLAGVVRTDRISTTAPDVSAPAVEVVAEPAAEVAQEPAVTIVAEPVVVSAVSEQTLAATAEPAPSTPYGHLFEETIVRSVADAAVIPVTEDDVEPVADEPAQTSGDHDGETVMSASLKNLLAGRPRVESDAPRIPDAPTLFLEVSTGQREQLDQTIIFGRAPSVSKVSGAKMPRLVTIPGDDDLSRNHVQFALEGGTVVVTDLHSRNGTNIVLPGKSPQTLRTGEPTSVLVGTVVDLGGGTTILIGQN